MTRMRRDDLLGISEREQIDQICLAFEDEWLRGDRPVVERCLAEAPSSFHGELLRELLLIELEYRRGLGEIPDAADYRDRFGCDAQVVRDVFAVVEHRSACLAFLPGHQIGRYRIKNTLGAGGFGTVYLAWDDQLQREVAIKVPHRSQLDSLRDRDRFLEEARVVARLKHPGIVPVYDSGRLDDDRVYLVMQYVNGRSLRAVMNAEGVAGPQAVEIAAEVAEAVHYAHRNGVVHRDLKPGNILIDTEGHVHVADFGLAICESEVGARRSEHAGTLAYMAPEQLEGNSAPLDGRADVWALGIILFEMLTGRVPFAGPDHKAVMHRILNDGPSSLRHSRGGISRSLQSVCLTCLAKRPEQRFRTAEELSVRLRQCRLPRHGRAAWAVAGVTVCGLMLLLLAALLWAGPPDAFHTPLDSWGTDAIDVVVWNPNVEAGGRLRLGQQPNAPVFSDDRVRLELRVTRPAFVYVVWISSIGEALPVFPWIEGNWSRRPDEEEPREVLALPSNPQEYWMMDEGPDGMETVLLLARRSRLPSTVSLEALLSVLRGQTIPVQPGVWRFVNGRRCGSRPRAPSLRRTTTVADPLLRLQWGLVDALKPHFDFIETISFPFRSRSAADKVMTSSGSTVE